MSKIKLIGIFAMLGGIILLIICLYFLRKYFIEVDNLYRNEYLHQGAAMALMLSIPFWLVASVSAHIVRDSIPNYIYLLVLVITFVVCGLFVTYMTLPYFK